MEGERREGGTDLKKKKKKKTDVGAAAAPITLCLDSVILAKRLLWIDWRNTVLAGKHFDTKISELKCSLLVFWLMSAKMDT